MSRRRQRRQADVMLHLLSPDGVEGSVRVEVKPRLVPRDAPELKRRLEGLAPDPALVMTELLTPNAKRRLTEEGLNISDLHWECSTDRVAARSLHRNRWREDGFESPREDRPNPSRAEGRPRRPRPL